MQTRSGKLTNLRGRKGWLHEERCCDDHAEVARLEREHQELINEIMGRDASERKETPTSDQITGQERGPQWRVCIMAQQRSVPRRLVGSSRRQTSGRNHVLDDDSATKLRDLRAGPVSYAWGGRRGGQLALRVNVGRRKDAWLRWSSGHSLARQRAGSGLKT
jgi:hypothetical protein